MYHHPASLIFAAGAASRYHTSMPRGATPLTDPTAPPPPPRPDARLAPIASWLHTVALFMLLTLTTVVGRARASAGHLHSAALAWHYAATMLLEWVLLALVLAGIHQRRAFLAKALRNRAFTLAQSLSLGVAVYLCGLIAIAFVSITLLKTPLAQHRNEAFVLAMLPHTPFDFVLWFGVSLSAGICEELIFRGYLLQQLIAWTRRPALSIVLAAALFGSVHLYEGLGAILPLAALAIVYGFVAHRSHGDLRAVIVAHTLQDFLVGFLGLARPYLERTRHLS